MTYVVAEPCIKCKYTDCVSVCPVEAIFSQDDLPDQWVEYLELNARLAAEWPEITRQKDALPEAEEFKDVKEKRSLLDESPGP